MDTPSTGRGPTRDELREDVEHKRDRRYALTLRKHRKDREADRAKDCADYALKHLQVERDTRSLVEDLETARREISPLYGEVSSLRIQTDSLYC